jgi:hypothetical protein
MIVKSITMNDEISPRTTAAPVRAGFWMRHKTVINFWLDVGLAVLFLMQAGLIAVLAVVFPPGRPGWTIWGATQADWMQTLLAVSGLFAIAVVLHVMLHWSWVCGTVATKLLGRKAGKDDGTQTLIGVGFLIVVLHLLGAFVFVAKVSLVSSQP